MLRIVNLEEFHRLMLRIPRIVDALERHTAEAPDSVRMWLIEVEGALEHNRMPLAGAIAGMRARLDSARRGAVPEGIVVTGSVTRRKLVDATAAEVLQRATDALSAELAPDGARVEEAARLARQLAVAAQAKGLVGPVPTAAEHVDTVGAIWERLVTEPDIAGGAVHLLSLVGPNDAVIVLDRALTRDVWA